MKVREEPIYSYSNLPRHTLNETHKHCDRGNLDNSDVIYHIPDNICEFSCHVILNSPVENLDSFQYSAALAVIGAWRDTFHEKLCNELRYKTWHL